MKMKTQKYYYSVNYASGRNTTTGTPNEKTGRLSIACNISASKTKTKRDELCENENYESIKYSELRRLYAGLSMSNFMDELNWLRNEAEFDNNL